MRVALFAVTILASFCIIRAQTDCSTLNNCSGHGQCQDGRCVCHSGFGSDDCSMTTTGCPASCFGQGQCLNGMCACSTGFTGEACNIVAPACPLNCTGHGLCVDGVCSCLPVWTGEACDQPLYNCPIELNNCTGHGECSPQDSNSPSSPWTCSCDEGFCGPACDRVCGTCQNNCTGHGICNRGVCTCDIGFSGVDCSLVGPVETCPNNCTGNGKCARVNGTFACVCSSCYRGLDCSESSVFCPGGCSGKGICDCDGVCHCTPGFTGEACEKVAATCNHLDFCSGNGQCNNGTCKCNPGFAGSKCNLACHTGGGNSTVGCHADQGHGTCTETSNRTAECVCKPEYEGVGCELETTDNIFDDYVNGWNPIGTVVIILVVGGVLGFVGGFTFNIVKGKRGINAVPGIQSIRSKVKGSEYEESLIGGSQRDVSNY